jgi:hypothetical protein
MNCGTFFQTRSDAGVSGRQCIWLDVHLTVNV